MCDVQREQDRLREEVCVCYLGSHVELGDHVLQGFDVFGGRHSEQGVLGVRLGPLGLHAGPVCGVGQREGSESVWLPGKSTYLQIVIS